MFSYNRAVWFIKQACWGWWAVTRVNRSASRNRVACWHVNTWNSPLPWGQADALSCFGVWGQIYCLGSILFGSENITGLMFLHPALRLWDSGQSFTPNICRKYQPVNYLIRHCAFLFVLASLGGTNGNKKMCKNVWRLPLRNCISCHKNHYQS